MKYLLIFSLPIILICACQQPQENAAPVIQKEKTSDLPEVDTSLYETFSYQEGDSTFLMKKYFMVHLKTGPKRDHEEGEAATIQEAHLAHLSQLAEDQKICIAGPFEAPESDIRGIVIYSVPNLEIADSLANADPAVQAGRLEVDVFPFWAAVGSKLF